MGGKPGGEGDRPNPGLWPPRPRYAVDRRPYTLGVIDGAPDMACFTHTGTSPFDVTGALDLLDVPMALRDARFVQ